MVFDITDKITLTSRGLIVPVKQYWLIDKLTQDKPLTCEIKEKKEKRSLNANNYCWALVGEIAEVIGTSNNEVYEQMITRYSKAYTFMAVKPSDVERTKATLKGNHIYAFEIGECKVNGKDATQLQLFYGSSTFDKKEMARLIDGIVSEAKELGIETATPDEIAKMKEEWK